MADFPTLKGADIQVRRSVEYQTIVQESASRMEVRAQFASVPRLRYTLRINFLRNDAAGDELKTLTQFYNSVRGNLGTFYFTDPNPDTATGAAGDSLVELGVMDSAGKVLCRFDMTAAEFDREMANVWSIRQVNLVSLLGTTP